MRPIICGTQFPNSTTVYTCSPVCGLKLTLLLQPLQPGLLIYSSITPCSNHLHIPKMVIEVKRIHTDNLGTYSTIWDGYTWGTFWVLWKLWCSRFLILWKCQYWTWPWDFYDCRYLTCYFPSSINGIDLYIQLNVKLKHYALKQCALQSKALCVALWHPWL